MANSKSNSSRWYQLPAREYSRRELIADRLVNFGGYFCSSNCLWLLVMFRTVLAILLLRSPLMLDGMHRPRHNSFTMFYPELKLNMDAVVESKRRCNTTCGCQIALVCWPFLVDAFVEITHVVFLENNWFSVAIFQL